MIKASVMYPAEPGARFDHDYYKDVPMPLGHPLRTLTNVVATPHIGYVADDLYRVFYADCVANITAWLDR